MSASDPKVIHWDTRLLDYGYAPGNYIIKCWHCKEQVWECDKRATSCQQCAEKRMNNNLAMYQGLE